MDVQKKNYENLDRSFILYVSFIMKLENAFVNMLG